MNRLKGVPAAMPQFRLDPGDPAPFEHIRRDGAADVLLTCDHASKMVPRALRGLGLAPEELARHIGWDIGAAAVTRLLADSLDAPAILAGYSRLVIDCNRDPGDASSIPEESDGTAVPANHRVGAEERALRHALIFAPYHAAIDDWLDARAARGVAPAVLSIHSFTPVMRGFARPWHVGVLWDDDGRIPVPLMAALKEDASLVVGDNKPYSAREPTGYTVSHHAVARGLPHVAIELRQDLVADDAGAARWAGILAAALRPILTRRDIYFVRRG